MKRPTLIVVSAYLLSLMILCAPLQGAPQTPGPEPIQLNDSQKEAIASIREITLQLILIAMGVFALIGGFATTEHRQFTARWLIALAFAVLALSVGFGLLAYGSLIYGLNRGEFNPGGIAALARGQWSCFAVGGVLLMISVVVNIRKAERKKDERKTAEEKR